MRVKIVEPENVDKYMFIGGKISPETVFEGLHAYAYAAAGPEIVQIHFDTEGEAIEGEKRLKEIGANTFAKIERNGTILTVWPNYLKKDIVNDQTRKYRMSYKVLSMLSLIGDVYYNDETGEVIVDDITDPRPIQAMVQSTGQQLYVEYNKEGEYVVIGAVEFVTKKPQE